MFETIKTEQLTIENIIKIMEDKDNNICYLSNDDAKVLCEKYKDTVIIYDNFLSLKKEITSENVTENLINKNLQISTMESCTSGLIASTITDTEGASQILKGSAVTYSNECKILEGVPEKTINNYGVYSKETAIEMSIAAKNKYKSDISIGVTGSLGNVDKNNLDSKIGQIDYCINYDKYYTTKIVFLDTNYTRKNMKAIVVDIILKQLNNIIQTKE